MLEELDDQSLLVLYVSDELAPSQRVAVQTRLAAEPALREALVRCKSGVASFQQAMEQADQAPLRSEAVVLRRIGQSMRQRLVEQAIAAARPEAVPTAARRFPMWSYPAAAAAIVLLGLVCWWGQRPDPQLAIPAVKPALLATLPGAQEDVVVAAKALEQNFEQSNVAQPDQAVAALSATEDQVDELSRSQSEFRYLDDSEQ